MKRNSLMVLSVFFLLPLLISCVVPLQYSHGLEDFTIDKVLGLGECTIVKVSSDYSQAAGIETINGEGSEHVIRTWQKTTGACNQSFSTQPADAIDIFVGNESDPRIIVLLRKRNSSDSYILISLRIGEKLHQEPLISSDRIEKVLGYWNAGQETCLLVIGRNHERIYKLWPSKRILLDGLMETDSVFIDAERASITCFPYRRKGESGRIYEFPNGVRQIKNILPGVTGYATERSSGKLEWHNMDGSNLVYTCTSDRSNRTAASAYCSKGNGLPRIFLWEDDILLTVLQVDSDIGNHLLHMSDTKLFFAARKVTTPSESKGILVCWDMKGKGYDRCLDIELDFSPESMGVVHDGNRIGIVDSACVLHEISLVLPNKNGQPVREGPE